MPQLIGANIVTHFGCRYIGRRHYASSSSYLRCYDSTDYSKTVFIPRSNFPHPHSPQVELNIQGDNKFAHTYLEQNPARKPYVIHDGPPFANGQIHLGHAINKILKDIAARYAMITGHCVEFITGWDCHGLPIELQVLKIIEDQQRQSTYGGNLLLESTTSPEHFRAKARSYAKSQVDLQMASFKRMGLLTDWNKRYTTDDPSYVANQLRAFSQLFEQKLIFKDLMPVNWSLVNQTTMADVDVEYRKDHISRSAYVLYEIIDPPFTADVPGQPIYCLVWTTTPWTLLENQAIAYAKKLPYCIVKATNTASGDSKNLLIAQDSMHRVVDLLLRLGYKSTVKTHFFGDRLEGLKYKPLLGSLVTDPDHDYNSPLPLLEADFVEGDKGTGLVHIAPNYGQDDFNLIKKHNLPIRQGLVDARGHYLTSAGSFLADKHIFSDGTNEIISIIDQYQSLLFTEPTQHSYPYEIRTNQPIIIRASQQVFLDVSKTVSRCVKALESVSFFPESRRQHFINTLLDSPNWCISRQRLWGTPIPVLYEVSDVNQERMITHPLIVEHFCKMLYKRRFMDYWWTTDNSELIPQELLDQCKLTYKSDELVRGMDIFDVWSDSGLSWHTVSNGLNDSKSQADLYLEGVDQIRGWFSSSSIFSMALRGTLPTKRFFLHGFAVDERGRKMSKSQGNVINPIKLFEDYGVDPVRLWAAKAAGHNNDISVKPTDFTSYVHDTIGKIRLTLRYLIGVLVDHDAVDVKLDHTKLQIFDQYFLDQLYRFSVTIEENYKNYRYDLVIAEVRRFLNNSLSPIYIATIKDILYCDDPDSERRKSCLTVLNLTYNILLRCLYPIIPHIVHEAGQYMRTSEPLNEWQDLGYKASWVNAALHSQFESIINLRSSVSRLLGPKSESMRSYDSIMFINDKKLFKSISKITNANPELMAELFKTSTFIMSYDEKLTPPSDVKEMSLSEPVDNGKPAKKRVDSEEPEFEILTSWSQFSDQEIRVGGTVSLRGGSPVRFEMCCRKSNNKKCSRCRRFSVLSINEKIHVCDRCMDALQKIELLD